MNEDAEELIAFFNRNVPTVINDLEEDCLESVFKFARLREKRLILESRNAVYIKYMGSG